jgi:hypothetical protein
MFTLRRRTGNTIAGLGIPVAAAILGLTAAPSAALGRDVTLGGDRVETGHGDPANQPPFHLPDSVLTLPRVVAYMRNQETGRWRKVLVDAYLQPADGKTLSQMRERLQDIAKRTRPQMEAHPAEFFEAAYEGPREAKHCIRLAAEESLGRSWAGEIFIRSLAVF